MHTHATGRLVKLLQCTKTRVPGNAGKNSTLHAGRHFRSMASWTRSRHFPFQWDKGRLWVNPAIPTGSLSLSACSFSRATDNIKTHSIVTAWHNRTQPGNVYSSPVPPPLQTYLHSSAEVAVQCQWKHVRAAALCSDSSSDVLYSTASLPRLTQRSTTSLPRSPGGCEWERERQRGRDVKVSMRGCFLPHSPLLLRLHSQDLSFPYLRVRESILAQNELDSAGWGLCNCVKRLDKREKESY